MTISRDVNFNEGEAWNWEGVHATKEFADFDAVLTGLDARAASSNSTVPVTVKSTTDSPPRRVRN